MNDDVELNTSGGTGYLWKNITTDLSLPNRATSHVIYLSPSSTLESNDLNIASYSISISWWYCYWLLRQGPWEMFWGAVDAEQKQQWTP